MKAIYVLIACEISQVEMNAFRSRGCIAYSCDVQLLQGSGDIRYHIPGDVTPYLQGERWFYTQDAQLHHVPRWDLIIAHPPCTYLCKVGSQHLYKKPNYSIEYNGERISVNRERYERIQDAREFFYRCLNAKAEYVAVENPIPMAIAGLPKPDTYLCPSWFGAKYTKKTLYWLRNLPPIVAGAENPDAKCYVTASRGKYRSRSFECVADAMAEQWIEYIRNDKKKKIK